MNYPDRVGLVRRVDTGEKDALGRPIYRDEVTEAPALVTLVSTKEVQDGAFLVTDTSIRLPAAYPVLPSASALTVLTGPLAGAYEVEQARPSRHHTRYIAKRVTTSA